MKARDAMTNHVVRLYALAASLLLLFLTWAAIASHPWSSASRSTTANPQVAAIQAREQRLRQEAIVVRRIVAGRWHNYRVALAARQRQIATAQRRQQQARRLTRYLLGAVGAGGHPASAHGHEDVVMQRRSFRAMGTKVELFLAAEAGRGSERRARWRRARVRAAGSALSRFRPGLRALAAEPRGPARSRRGPARRRRARARGAGADARTFRPDRARRARRRRLRPHVRGGRRAEGAHRLGARRAAAGACPSTAGADASSSSPESASTSAGSARATPPTARRRSSRVGPCARRRGRRHRRRRSARLARLARSGVETADARHARAR